MRQRRSSTIGGKNGLVGELRLAVGVDLFEAIGQLVHFVGKTHVGKAVALILQGSATALQGTDRGSIIPLSLFVGTKVYSTTLDARVAVKIFGKCARDGIVIANVNSWRATLKA